MKIGSDLSAIDRNGAIDAAVTGVWKINIVICGAGCRMLGLSCT